MTTTTTKEQIVNILSIFLMLHEVFISRVMYIFVAYTYLDVKENCTRVNSHKLFNNKID